MNRLERLLMGTLVLLLLLVGGLGLLLWRQQATADATLQDLSQNSGAQMSAAEVTAEGTTALLAYVPARERARAWQEDAMLVRTTATWPRGVGAETLAEGAENWSFVFYSPAARAAAFVSVVDGEATVTREQPVADAPVTGDASSWQVDSNQALQIMLAEGGSRFLENAGTTTVNATLLTNAEGDVHPEWKLSAYGVDSGRSFIARINANSGAVVGVESSPDGG